MSDPWRGVGVIERWGLMLNEEGYYGVDLMKDSWRLDQIKQSSSVSASRLDYDKDSLQGPICFNLSVQPRGRLADTTFHLPCMPSKSSSSPSNDSTAHADSASPPQSAWETFFNLVYPAELKEYEKPWRDRYNFLLDRGYRLRPRYHPEWTASWKAPGAKKNPVYCEDAHENIVR
jgi:hypothetical protein